MIASDLGRSAKTMSRSFIFFVGLLLGATSGAISGLWWSGWKRDGVRWAAVSHFENASLDRLPFDGTWQIAEGGDNESQNAHHGLRVQHLAMDIVKIDDSGRRTHAGGDRTRNESYLSWGQPLYSPIQGTIEIATDGIPDNLPGEKNGQMVYGNSVMIRDPAGSVVVMAHFKNGSVTKRRGDQVQAGELLGLCGNSGNSREPHLHFQVQSEMGYEKGVAVRPVFRSLVLNGKPTRPYSPVKGDIVANANEEPNKASEPTTTAVTSPAAQEPRQP
jgi:murein DD-endopeptidase MepM/ murein hydrolase activator NlpD